MGVVLTFSNVVAVSPDVTGVVDTNPAVDDVAAPVMRPPEEVLLLFIVLVPSTEVAKDDLDGVDSDSVDVRVVPVVSASEDWVAEVPVTEGVDEEEDEAISDVLITSGFVGETDESVAISVEVATVEESTEVGGPVAVAFPVVCLTSVLVCVAENMDVPLVGVRSVDETTVCVGS